LTYSRTMKLRARNFEKKLALIAIIFLLSTESIAQRIVVHKDLIDKELVDDIVLDTLDAVVYFEDNQVNIRMAPKANQLGGARRAETVTIIQKKDVKTDNDSLSMVVRSNAAVIQSIKTSDFYRDSHLWFLLGFISLITMVSSITLYRRITRTLLRGKKTESHILQYGDKYFIGKSPIEDFFVGKELALILQLLKNSEKYIPLQDLDDIFLSNDKVSRTTLKKRREMSLLNIIRTLGIVFDLPPERIFMIRRDEDDQRIKLIKFNAEELLKVKKL
jgi:hypothetical protein